MELFVATYIVFLNWLLAHWVAGTVLYLLPAYSVSLQNSRVAFYDWDPGNLQLYDVGHQL